MKCPYCGAETQSTICEYCGSEMPKQQQNINVTNNYYGDTHKEEKNTNVSVGTCPKCGSTKISFKRERIGTATRSSSRKKYVGKGRKGQVVTQSTYRTVGLCQNCGFTWNPNGGSNTSSTKSDAPMWLWILGWVCIFPLPLTVLMLRKREMKPAVKYGIILVAWIVYLIMVLSGNSNDTTTSIDSTATNNTKIAVENNSEVKQTNSDLEATTHAEISVERYIDDIVEKYNSKVDEKLEYMEEFTPSDEESSHYRTEFRLGAWKDAVGKSYLLGESIVDIVAVKTITGSMNFRVYGYCGLEQVSLMVNGISPLLDEDLTATELSDAINTIENMKTANGYYFGDLGLQLLEKDNVIYEFMLKLE